MLLLNPDKSFHFELLRVLSLARYYGSDIAEVLAAAGRIDKPNTETFYNAFIALAERVESQANVIDVTRHPVSARDAYFRASSYYRVADFYLHGNPSDQRINALWEKQTVTFNKAIALMNIPGQRITLRGNGFDIPAIYYPASGDPSTPKPTLIVGSGYDGAQEELLHLVGFAALERGYNFITYEGPGQPTVVRQQNLGFIPDWENVVTPVVDYLVTIPGVDVTKLALFGLSMGGYLAVRAAAFEHRIAATIANDGVYDIYEAYRNAMPPPLKDLLDSGEKEKFDAQVREGLKSDNIPMAMRWGIEQGLWSFNASSPWEWMQMTKKMTLEGLADQVQCPVWVGEAAEDQFFLGQPERVRDALGDKATFVALTSEDAAGNHCHVGAQTLFNQIAFDWLDDLFFK